MFNVPGIDLEKQVAAHNKVQEAIRSGRLKPPNGCSNCGKKTTKIHAHHSNYDHPLRVVWLCFSCHRTLHSLAIFSAWKKGAYPHGDIDRFRWLRKNRGILTKIAEATGYKRTMVSLVFNKRRSSSDGSIEEELKRLDAPGWNISKKPIKKA